MYLSKKRDERKTYVAFVIALSLFLVVILLLTAYGNNRPLPHKGTWIWDASATLTHREEIVAFAKENGVTHIYLCVDRERVTPQDYILFIQAAAKSGIRVEALGGEPTWGLKEGRGKLQEFIEWVAGYNANVDEEARFSGIHLDVEPYLLPAWQTERDRVVEEWLANMDFAAKQAEWLSQLKVTVDLPFWVQDIPVPGYADLAVGTWMLKRFDTVVLMDYRDRAEGEDGIVFHALRMVDEASALNKALIVGVEMAPSAESKKITFYEEGHEVMVKELEIARKHLERYRSFQGFAIHGFWEWVSAKQKGEEKGSR